MSVDDLFAKFRAIDTAVSLNKAEVVRVVGISRPTLERWIEDGLPMSVVAGSNRVFCKDLIDFLVDRKDAVRASSVVEFLNSVKKLHLHNRKR